MNSEMRKIMSERVLKTVAITSNEYTLFTSNLKAHFTRAIKNVKSALKQQFK